MSAVTAVVELETPARDYFPGMGQAVADRTVNRRMFTDAVKARLGSTVALNPKDPLLQRMTSAAMYSGITITEDPSAAFMTAMPETRVETWAEVADRVALGNTSLLRTTDQAATEEVERLSMRHHLRQGSLLMSGRHLQHGDETQAGRPQEVFTNCSTAVMRCLNFRLLLNGSGVGGCYDDALVTAADMNDMPIVVPVIDHTHADVQSGRIAGYLTGREAKHLYAGSIIKRHTVADSREGWARAIEIIERMAFQKKRHVVLLLDFSDVRGYGEPIRGMQNRPASGPGPLMQAVSNMARLRDAGMPTWRAAMYADHYLADCVLVGGARRAARMATKTWRDVTVVEFIGVKRGGFLWSANNSVTIDDEFRIAVEKVAALVRTQGFGDEALEVEWQVDWPQFSNSIEMWLSKAVLDKTITGLEAHAWRVFMALAAASYFDGTGEPGLIMVDRLNRNDDGLKAYLDGSFVTFGGEDGLEEATRPLAIELAKRVLAMPYKFIVNPCGEISLLMLGGYCVIADVVPFHAQSDADAESAFRTATRALIRTNTMRSLYRREVARTNRIGVGITGLHEWIFARFGLGFRDIVAEDPSGATMIDANGQTMVRPHPDALPMWMMLARFARAVQDEADAYCARLGVNTPHTLRTIKPAGTTSKLFGLTEGAHLPAMREYLRWVQFRNDDPLVETYRKSGYPVRELRTYSGTTVVGFPTQPAICQLGMGDKLITAGEAGMEEQYRYLRLLETFWIRGVDEAMQVLADDRGNQVSYTAKYEPAVTDFKTFVATMMDGQFKIRCCSVMPQIDTTAFEYQPEQAVTKAEFEMIAQAIQRAMQEDVGLEHVDCASGACPVDFNTDAEIEGGLKDQSLIDAAADAADVEFMIYAKPECGWCTKAKALLDDIGASYGVVTIKTAEVQRAFFIRRGVPADGWTFPKVYARTPTGEVLIGGYEDLAARLGA
ncbi:ribonucleoside-diphosphate reductase [Roseospira marina]|uniref:Ribonucleoside-diphosphate reductase n=1 Tax=Roseospira marina TaxID=140057 RepID=A0A5M6I8V8_9PROT|nr:glutaredoxin domain-containing protein [Roseospira marina]KAA5604367.1 ribonucleoside-diphosphate reductase [Roseospira marina]MBB4315447.1 glutaredoxin [Roseospira marina]MBB5088407.1 glutaredoxin [Roseospira marina]